MKHAILIRSVAVALLGYFLQLTVVATAADDTNGIAFFEKKIRPLLVKHCYECHSERAQDRRGGLLLDRRSGWINGGDTEKAVVPGDADSSLLIRAIRYDNENLQMPPESPLSMAEIQLFERWVELGAPGPADDMGDTEFSRLGDQNYLFEKASKHWSFQPVTSRDPVEVESPQWNRRPIDRFVYSELRRRGLTPSEMADPRKLIQRLTFDLTGLPRTYEQIEKFAAEASLDREAAIQNLVGELLRSPAFGEHIGRMWLDVARYADTDSFYRPDTRTPHYFPFAFTYRDYVVESFNSDKPYNQFIREQLAADLMGFEKDAPELAALGFLAVGPHANRNQAEALDDWIDVTTRGLLGLTAACARCHDHKYEPIPTADYYSLHGIFASIVRPHPLREEQLPVLQSYTASDEDTSDYREKRAAIDAKIEAAGKKTVGGNRRSVAQKIRETELAELLLFHPGAPAHAMVVKEKSKPVSPYIFLRGNPASKGESVARRFLKVLDAEQTSFPDGSSGRLQLADKIVDAGNPLVARVFVNRVWGMLMGSYLVDTPSDFGLQGSSPSHPQLLDWLASDFVSHGWSVKRLIRTIVSTQSYQQSSDHREEMSTIDPQNRFLWRANRKHLSIEVIRDRLLAVAGQLDRTPRGRASELWGDNYTKRRSIYGYINRFNLDPTLRVFDFPSPMQSQSDRGESIVAPQALFLMNSSFVIDRAVALTESATFQAAETDDDRVTVLFRSVYQRDPEVAETTRIVRFAKAQQRFFAQPNESVQVRSVWPLMAQSLLMSNEFQYVD